MGAMEPHGGTAMQASPAIGQAYATHQPVAASLHQFNGHTPDVTTSMHMHASLHTTPLAPLPPQQQQHHHQHHIMWQQQPPLPLEASPPPLPPSSEDPPPLPPPPPPPEEPYDERSGLSAMHAQERPLKMFKRAGRPTAAANRVRSIDDYEQRRVIGNGTFGQVFEAIDRRNKMPVAIKLVKMERESEGIPITALREIRLLQTLHHLNIVRLIEVVKGSRHPQGEATESPECGELHMVFEYVDNDLAGLLEMSPKDLTPIRVKTFMLHLLEGMDYMHKHNIVHRDLKCANLLISREGILKIADWGLARIINGRDQNQAYTQKVITLWYRPPELLMSSKHYGFAVDMWSAGCIFGEMVQRSPLLPGREEPDQLELAARFVLKVNLPDYDHHRLNFQNHPRPPQLRQRLFDSFKSHPLALEMLQKLLALDPARRPPADEAKYDAYFKRPPHAAEPGQLPPLSGSGYHEHQAKLEVRKRNLEAHSLRRAREERQRDQAMVAQLSRNSAGSMLRR
ncbi:kinase-like domain-containing protein [Tribonema minus]|uniref:Cyclin-dependent kinase 2 homolog n=1 Tax=Tribonema minus TaxID=303371 RepID=A0A835YV82_9STRA|nr:kinase-like domain-containing protein [Tribonema minus]